MKKYNNLYDKITSFRNLLFAAQKAQKGKRFESATALFNFQLEKELFALQTELETETYLPDTYHAFYIYEPKPRMISAAPYRDRVVHHALCNIISPILEESMIYDSYANRKGKGTHAVIKRYQYFAKQYKYVLKCDIQKFFPSIDHEILKQQIRKKIICTKTLGLIDKIIDNSNLQEPADVYFEGDDLFTPFERRKGLPIGNLTSQLWGNYYLNELDKFMKETLKCKGYVRYVDDFAVFANEKAALHQILSKIAFFLKDFRLKLHPKKCHVYPLSEGVPFLGHRLFPHFRLLKKENVRRARKRLRKLAKNYHSGVHSWEEIYPRLQSWLAHAKFSCTFRLRNQIICEFWGL
jgi:retron-type reverse transcriptase